MFSKTHITNVSSYAVFSRRHIIGFTVFLGVQIAALVADAAPSSGDGAVPCTRGTDCGTPASPPSPSPDYCSRPPITYYDSATHQETVQDRSQCPPSQCVPCAGDEQLMSQALRMLETSVLQRNQVGSKSTQSLKSFSMQDGTSTNPIEICSAIRNFPWEDENHPHPPNQAFNCRDFSRWFRECLVRLGFPPTDVEILGMDCSGCASGGLYAHVINLFKEGDKWCAFEPQWDPATNQRIFGACCSEDKGTAAACALSAYCRNQGSWDACCKEGKWWIATGEYCNEMCRWVNDSNGTPVLHCPIPEIGDGGPFPPKPSPAPRSACDEAVHKCLTTTPAPSSCNDCAKSKLPECAADCKNKPTNAECTACCIQQTGNKDPERMKCLRDSGCVNKR